jgi:hypothetical protein
MKHLISNLFILLVFSLTAYTANAQTENGDMASQKDVVQVIDFHSTHRCMTCNAIESKTTSTLNTYFKQEMEDGTITFQAVNVEDKDNYDLAEEFEAAGTSLFINVMKDGKSSKVDLTEFAFMNATNSDNSFEIGLKEEIQKALNLL